jgi:hypothetical protein
MAERNPHDKWGSKINVQFREMMHKAKKANAVPIGEERLSTSEARKRFVEMSDPERKRFIEQKGEEEVLRMLRGQ